MTASRAPRARERAPASRGAARPEGRPRDVAAAVLAAQRGAGNRAVGRWIQRLPLTGFYEEFEAEVKGRTPSMPWFRIAGDYADKMIAPHLAEVEADDRVPVQQYGAEWKLSVYRAHRRLRDALRAKPADQMTVYGAMNELVGLLRAESVELGRAEQAIDDAGQGLDAMAFGLHPRAELPPPAVAEMPGGQAAALEGMKAGLTSPTAAVRTQTIEANRAAAGAILAPHILDERRALLGLVEQASDCAAVFSLERGGAFVADAVVRLAAVVGARAAAMTNVKVPKPTPQQVLDIARVEPTRPSDRKDPVKWAAGQRTVHAELLKREVIRFVQASGETDITIAITETAVSGSSVVKVLATANELLQTLKLVAPGKRVKFKILGLREMIKKDASYAGRGQVHVQDPLRLIEEEGRRGERERAAKAKAEKGGASSSSAPAKKKDDMGGVPHFPPDDILTEDLDKVSLYLAQTQYLIGEDVDFQMAVGGEQSQRPVVVFDAEAGNVAALEITPGGGGDTARAILLDLLAGVYDRTIEQMLAGLRE